MAKVRFFSAGASAGPPGGASGGPYSSGLQGGPNFLVAATSLRMHLTQKSWDASVAMLAQSFWWQLAPCISRPSRSAKPPAMFRFRRLLAVAALIVAAQAECQCDPGSNACESRANDSDYYYLCDLSAMKRTCRKDVERSRNCECLNQGGCLSMALLPNPPACAKSCMVPKAIDLCSNYDDQNSWCGYYGQLRCMADSPECTNKPQMSPCEVQCDAAAAAHGGDDYEKFDAFLQCVSECKKSAGIVV